MSTSLSDIAKAYANYLSGKYNGGGLWFTATTDYHSVSPTQLDKYKSQHQMTATYINDSISYSDVKREGPPNPTMFGTVYVNNRDASGDGTASLGKDTTTSQSFSYTKSSAISVGTEVSAGVGFKEIFNASAKINTEVTFSNSRTDTSETIQTWKADFSHIVPPGERLYGACYVETQKYTAQWKALILLSGKVAMWFNNAFDLRTLGGSNKHQLWFVPISNVISECQSKKIINVDGYSAFQDGTATLQTNGSVKGIQGINMYALWSKDPLPQDAPLIAPNSSSILRVDQNSSVQSPIPNHGGRR